MYLNKPVMMVPVKGHFEQFCNAKDASKLGSVITSDEFNLGKMEHYLLFHRNADNQPYRAWVNQMEEMVLAAIHSLLPEESVSQSSVIMQENQSLSHRPAY
jgi:hypothetical protein